MSVHKRNPSPSPSLSSVISDVSISNSVSSEGEEIRNFAKKCLKKRLFLGHYQERRYVEYLGVYRDMVVLHASEIDLKGEIDRVQSKLRHFYGDGKWLGFTNPDTIGAPAAGHCIWTKLEEVAFGFYWFQIKQICFQDKEIYIRLKVVRAVQEEICLPVKCNSFTQSFSENVDSLKTRICAGINSLKENEASVPKSSESKTFKNIPPESTKDDKGGKGNDKENDPVPDSTTVDNTNMVVTQTLNIKHVLEFLHIGVSCLKEIFRFLIVAGTGLGKCIEYIGNFSIKLIHEASFLIESLTPILLSIIELVGKAIGGLYLLIAMIVRGPPPPRQQLQPNDRIRMLAIRNGPEGQRVYRRQPEGDLRRNRGRDY